MQRNYLSDDLPVVATIDPQLVDDAAVTSDWVDMNDHQEVMFILNVGATDTTVDAKIQSADDTSGTNAADISSLAVTQLSATDDNKQVVLTVRKDQLNSGDVAVALVVTVGNGTTGAQVSAIGVSKPHYGPASFVDLASVAEIVTL